MKASLLGALVLLSGCISSTKSVDVAPDAREFAREVAKPGAVVVVTLHKTGYAAHLKQTKLTGDQLCGAPMPKPNHPPPPETLCFAIADVKEVRVIATGDDPGATAAVWGTLASCVVLLPLCFAAGATAPGQ